MSDRERVEALAKVIVSHQRIPTFDGSGRYRCSGCDHLLGQTDGPNSPRHAAHLAEMLTDSSAMRDLLAEAKADALREAASAVFYEKGRFDASLAAVASTGASEGLSEQERADLRYEAGIILSDGPDCDDDGRPCGEYVVAEGLVRALDEIDQFAARESAAATRARAEGAATGWAEAVEAVAWCLDNGEPSAAAALAHVHKNNPHAARIARGDA